MEIARPLIHPIILFGRLAGFRFFFHIWAVEFLRFKTFILDFLEKNIPGELTYHSFQHTLNVVGACERIADYEGITGEDKEILMTAAFLHDVGFTRTYVEHEAAGCEIARELLPQFGYSSDQIELITCIIMSTKIPQGATLLLEKILCDADLDYLGTDQFFPIGDGLYLEFLKHGIVRDEEGWNRLQVKFLSSHSYFTAYSLEFRNPKKLENLEKVKEIVAGYDASH